MGKPNFDNLFKASSLNMMAAFLQTMDGGRPDEIGSPRENQLREFLMDWLPEKYGVSKGYVLNESKHISKECDVVIFDRHTCPKFFQDVKLDVRFFPKNETLATFEVKSTLNEKELLDSLEKIESVIDVGITTIHDLSFGDEWEERDIKLAKPDNRYIDEEDYIHYKGQIKKERLRYSNPITGIFAYRMGDAFSFQELKERLVKIKNGPSHVLILDTGLLIKLDALALKRYKSMKENKTSKEVDDFLVTWEVVQAKWSYAGQDYLIIESNDPSVNLMYFYTFVIDHLNSFTKHPKSVAADIISVFKNPTKSAE